MTVKTELLKRLNISRKFEPLTITAEEASELAHDLSISAIWPDRKKISPQDVLEQIFAGKVEFCGRRLEVVGLTEHKEKQ